MGTSKGILIDPPIHGKVGGESPTFKCLKYFYYFLNKKRFYLDRYQLL